MVNSTRRRGSAPLAALLGWLLAVGFGCAGSLRAPVSYAYFHAPDPADPWSRKIHFWQQRERAEREEAALDAPAAVGGSGQTASDPGADGGDLRAKYDAFRAERKRALARDLAEWIQSQARHHYVEDGPIDHWATLEETLRSNGDDCDGLELLVYHALRDLGFTEEEVFRAIVYRRSDGQHHMVTLWFEDRDDPWVIDPTGAMTSGFHRMSSMSGWVPLKVFGEARDYTVEPRALARHAAE